MAWSLVLANNAALFQVKSSLQATRLIADGIYETPRYFEGALNGLAASTQQTSMLKKYASPFPLQEASMRSAPGSGSGNNHVCDASYAC